MDYVDEDETYRSCLPVVLAVAGWWAVTTVVYVERGWRGLAVWGGMNVAASVVAGLTFRVLDRRRR